MRSKSAAALLAALWICVGSVFSAAEVEPVLWHGAKSHNRWTEWMLFGNPSYSSYKAGKTRLAVEQLEDALLICVDQFNGNYQDKLDKLCFIQGVPERIDAIDFTAGNNKEETSHRAYTHRGWNHHYTDFEREKSHPDTRKQILLSVVGHVFSLNKRDPSGKNEKLCDAMCCLLYNLHIIEDRYHSTAYYGAASTLPLADAGTKTESVTHDLLECIPTLFPVQRKENHVLYRELVSGLQRIAGDIISERRKNTDKEAYLLIDRKYAEQLKNLLAACLPGLLRMQAWFSSVFSSDWKSD